MHSWHGLTFLRFCELEGEVISDDIRIVIADISMSSRHSLHRLVGIWVPARSGVCSKVDITLILENLKVCPTAP